MTTTDGALAALLNYTEGRQERKETEEALSEYFEEEMFLEGDLLSIQTPVAGNLVDQYVNKVEGDNQIEFEKRALRNVGSIFRRAIENAFEQYSDELDRYSIRPRQNYSDSKNALSATLDDVYRSLTDSDFNDLMRYFSDEEIPEVNQDDGEMEMREEVAGEIEPETDGDAEWRISDEVAEVVSDLQETDEEVERRKDWSDSQDEPDYRIYEEFEDTIREQAVEAFHDCLESDGQDDTDNVQSSIGRFEVLVKSYSAWIYLYSEGHIINKDKPKEVEDVVIEGNEVVPEVSIDGTTIEGEEDTRPSETTLKKEQRDKITEARMEERVEEGTTDEIKNAIHDIEDIQHSIVLHKHKYYDLNADLPDYLRRTFNQEIEEAVEEDLKGETSRAMGRLDAVKAMFEQTNKIYSVRENRGGLGQLSRR